MGKEPLFTHTTRSGNCTHCTHPAILVSPTLTSTCKSRVHNVYCYTTHHSGLENNCNHTQLSYKGVGEQAYYNYNCEQTLTFQTKQEIQTTTPTRANKNLTMLTWLLTESHFSPTRCGALSAPAASDGDVHAGLYTLTRVAWTTFDFIVQCMEAHWNGVTPDIFLPPQNLKA